jgi:hypothetical protein
LPSTLQKFQTPNTILAMTKTIRTRPDSMAICVQTPFSSVGEADAVGVTLTQLLVEVQLRLTRLGEWRVAAVFHLSLGLSSSE